MTNLSTRSFSKSVRPFGIVLYAWLIYTFTILVLQITAFVAVAGVLGIAAWIGWMMATTPPLARFEPENP